MTLVVAACDGEPFVATGRWVAEQHAERLVLAARARAAADEPVRFVVERRATVAAAALARVVAAAELIVVADEIGCAAPARLAAAAGDPAATVVHAAELVAGPGERVVTLAGAVAAPGVRLVARALAVAGLVERAGGAGPAGPAWVAVTSVFALVALDREAALPEGARALIVLPGDAELARRARGDRAGGGDPRSPLGLDPAWLGPAGAALGTGAGAGGSAGGSSLSIDLVARRLGLVPDALGWPTPPPPG